ncbi:MAG: phospholipase D family protein [Phycisphaerales bacterium]
MPRYLDTGAESPDDCLGTWLEREVIAGIHAFRAQLGFFSYGALNPFANVLRAIGEDAAPIRLVIGSNNGSLTQVDLSRTWAIFDGLADARLTVVAYSNAMFHPKVIHVVRNDDSQTAIVGSGNLTGRGLAFNVEASISVDSRDGDNVALLNQIATAIDRWHDADVDGVYPISSADDVRRLTAATLIDLPQPGLPTLPEPTQQGTALKAGRRSRLWRPTAPAAVPAGAIVAPAPPEPATAMIPRWCKKLRSSDAQQVTGRTSATAELRLTKSNHPIDRRTYFRQQFFHPTVWTSEMRPRGRTYEITDIDFHVIIHGNDLGVHTLRIDHALHREAGQGNYVTALRWGSELGRQLRSHSYIDSWVVLEHRADGTFALRIEATKPAWAP